jgi:hypothetical protein
MDTAVHPGKRPVFKLEIGQRLQFFEPVHLESRHIAAGTIVRIGAIMNHLLGEPDVTVTTQDQHSELWKLPRHVLTMHCWPL